MTKWILIPFLYLLFSCVSDPVCTSEGAGTEAGNPCQGPGTEEGNPALKVSVLAIDGTPVPGAKLILYRKKDSVDKEIDSIPDLEKKDSVITDSLGQFVFDKLVVGQYALAAKDNRNGHLAYRKSIRLDKGKTLHDTLLVKKPSVLTGRVLLANYTPSVSSGEIQITLENSYLWYQVKHGKKFVIDDIPPGVFDLSVFSPYYIRKHLNEITFFTGDTVNIGDVILEYSPYVKLPQPVGIKAIQTTGKIIISWNEIKVADLAGYQMMGFMPPESNFPYLDTIIYDSSFTDTSPGPANRKYKLRSIDSSGNFSDWKEFLFDSSFANNDSLPIDTLEEKKKNNQIPVLVLNEGNTLEGVDVSLYEAGNTDSACLNGFSEFSLPLMNQRTGGGGLVVFRVDSIAKSFTITAGTEVLSGIVNVNIPLNDTIILQLEKSVSITGRISRNGNWMNHPTKGDEGIEVLIPHSPWLTRTRNDGGFQLSGIPASFPILKIQTYDFETVELQNINISPGTDTVFGPVELRFFPCNRLPPPRDIQWEIDSIHRLIHLNWNNLGDSANYSWDVERCLIDPCLINWETVTRGVDQAAWNDTLLSWPDSLLQYRIKTLDSTGNDSEWMRVEVWAD